MSNQVLKVGVVGLGQIAQIMHLRYLKELPTFEIAAVCDISPTMAQNVGAHYGVERRYTDYHQLLDQKDIDIVLNVTRNHYQVSMDALNAGKHVMTEKPIGFNLDEADDIIAATKRNKKKLQVAYMKRYDPSFQWAMERFKQMKDLRLIRVHDFGGAFRINNEIYDLYSANDFPQDLIKSEEEQVTASLVKAIGSDRADLAHLYSSLLHLCTHDTIILRAAFGEPKNILYVDNLDGQFCVGVLDYGNGVRCMWESGMVANASPWDESLTAYGSDAIVRVDFPFPYLHNGETVVTVKEKDGASFVEKHVTASFDEAFKREWRHFYECVTEDKEPITNGAEGKADVALLANMVKAIRR